MPESNPITPDANSNITLSTLVEVLADTELEIGKTSDYHPTSGRVLKDSEDGTIYLADGTSWNDVSSAIGIDSPRTQTGQLAGDWDTLVTTDDDLESVISNAVDGEVIALEAGTHTITSPLKTSKRITIKSAGLNVKGAEWDPNSNTADAELTAWDGPVIEQQTAGNDVIHFGENEEAQQVVTKDVLLTWKSSLRDSDTGHGLIFDAPEDPDTVQKLNGVYHWVLENVAVLGHDGDSYAFKIINSLQGHARDIQSYGGGGWHWVENHSGTNMGNAVITNSYHRWDNDGSAHGIEYETNNGTLNFITWVRLQINAFNVTAGSSHIKRTNNGTDIKGLTYLGVDLEGTSDGIEMNRGKGHSWIPAAVTDSLYNASTGMDVVHIPEKDLEIHTDYGKFPNVQSTGMYELKAPSEQQKSITYNHNDTQKQTEVQFAKYWTKVLDFSGRNNPFIYEDSDASVERWRVTGSGESKPQSGYIVPQRAADPGTGDLADGEAMLYLSDGSADATGAAMDLIYAANDGGTIETATIVDESADAS